MTTAGARTIGLDLGSVRCGVAIDDELGELAFPRAALPAGDRAGLVRALVALARENGADRFVLGLPLELSGREGRAAEKSRTFARSLVEASKLAVELWDERLSTVAANRALREAGHDSRGSRTRVDSAAAAMLLQSWLDARRAKIARAEREAREALEEGDEGEERGGEPR
jgi:putative Holliday junction resolvase